MVSFSPSNYLKGLGWNGPGSGLNDSPHARARPVTVAQKKSLSGVGKDRDTAFPWWEMVFAHVATKVVQDGGSATSGSEDRKEPHRTVTGIISPRPPPPPLDDPSTYSTQSPSCSTSGTSTPIMVTTTNRNTTLSSSSVPKSALNQDALGAAKLEIARRQLYSGFRRGTVLGGSISENKSVTIGDETSGKGEKRGYAEKSPGGTIQKVNEQSHTSKTEKKRRKEEDKDRKSIEKATTTNNTTMAEMNGEGNALKKKKKEKSNSKLEAASSNKESSTPLDENNSDSIHDHPPKSKKSKGKERRVEQDNEAVGELSGEERKKRKLERRRQKELDRLAVTAVHTPVELSSSSTDERHTAGTKRRRRIADEKDPPEKDSVSKVKSKKKRKAEVLEADTLVEITVQQQRQQPTPELEHAEANMVAAAAKLVFDKERKQQKKAKRLLKEMLEK